MALNLDPSRGRRGGDSVSPYAIERLRELTGRFSIAGILSCTVFALEHVGVWGWGHLLIAGSAGVILTLLYIWRRNLWVNMIAHFVPDAIGLLLS